MMRGVSSGKKKSVPQDSGFTDLVFSWSLEDIFNEDHYKNQVDKIPESFQSVEDYFGAFVFPLLEETRAEPASCMDVIHGAPFAEVGRTWTWASVTKISEDENEGDNSLTHFKVKASQDIEVKDGMCQYLFVTFLINITTNRRIWSALCMFGNLKIIKEVICTDSGGLRLVESFPTIYYKKKTELRSKSYGRFKFTGHAGITTAPGLQVQENCKLCSDSQLTKRHDMSLLSKLNESQTEATLASLCRIKCGHKSTAELIWGPPGTGKTKTVSLLLFTLLRMNCRTLTCAPTNIAINEVASRVLKLVRESFEAESAKDVLFCSLGDILLFGNKARLKVDSEIQGIYLDYRVDRLAECLGPLTGWRHCFTSMIDFLEDSVSQYNIFVENEMIKEKKHGGEDFIKSEVKSFLEFVRDRFKSTASSLRRYTFVFCTHLPRRFILESNFQNMLTLNDFLDYLEELLFQDNVVSEELEGIFLRRDSIEHISESFADTNSLMYTRRNCRSVLKILQRSLQDLDLPSAMNKGSNRDFCFQMASLIFCTASSSYKLHSVEMEPLNLLVIDEAAQLKECESTIPLQLPGLSHAILVGDECQLPAMVTSNEEFTWKSAGNLSWTKLGNVSQWLVVMSSRLKCMLREIIFQSACQFAPKENYLTRV
ncbi:helicase sen1-like isoform X2 [Actinidia eriantha]|uniref:helicase sen1-like isoform X2 n=1 Tax=Actinidia eriantha TaxID=165200 RepID=UPI00258E03EC|nr:helicase sen1-like isoform X2 [Actinidia eriantha]